MTLYVIVGENNETYGIFTKKQFAEDEKKNIYNNGYFGELDITEEEIVR